jgi:hypothetical protein
MSIEPMDRSMNADLGSSVVVEVVVRLVVEATTDVVEVVEGRRVDDVTPDVEVVATGAQAATTISNTTATATRDETPDSIELPIVGPTPAYFV